MDARKPSEKAADTIAAIIDPSFRVYRKCTEDLEAVERRDVLQEGQLNGNRKSRDKARERAEQIIEWLKNGGVEQITEDMGLLSALTGFGDDFMTSEQHHPGYVLIPTDQFERIRTAMSETVGATESYHADLLRRYIHHARHHFDYNAGDLLTPDHNNAFRGRRWFTDAEMAELKRLAALPESEPLGPKV